MPQRFLASGHDSGSRLDRFLASRASGISRTRLQRFIKNGLVHINGVPIFQPKTKISQGDVVEFEIPEPAPIRLEPENIKLDLIYEDEHLLVINKAAGMVVHPGAGHETGTVVHAVLHHCKDLAGIGDKMRPGIVHRLDRDTSGVLVIAKTQQAHQSLVAQFACRSTCKNYLTLVRGKPSNVTGSIAKPIGRNPIHRKKMAAVQGGREAITLWRIIKELRGASLLDIRILTGRTHQIRVHMASAGHPVLGDALYGGPSHLTVNDAQVKIPRQMLHAARLELTHPATGERLCWKAPLPEDMQKVMEMLG